MARGRLAKRQPSTAGAHRELRMIKPMQRPHASEGADGRVGPPDFIGVGTRGSGWEWWADQVFAHPGVTRPLGDSVAMHAFDREWRSRLDNAAIARYHAMFPRSLGQRTGEWTADYAAAFWVPPLIHRAAPDARLLLMVRDPVERFAADRLPGEPAWAPRAAANARFQAGLYAEQLERLWAAVPRDRVLVLQLELCRLDPDAQLGRTLRFLGVQPASNSLAGRPDAAPSDAESELSRGQRDVLARRYAAENLRLATMVPELDLSLWTRP
jgi:Sulfotransferase family